MKVTFSFKMRGKVGKSECHTSPWCTGTESKISCFQILFKTNLWVGQFAQFVSVTLVDWVITEKDVGSIQSGWTLKCWVGTPTNQPTNQPTAWTDLFSTGGSFAGEVDEREINILYIAPFISNATPPLLAEWARGIPESDFKPGLINLRGGKVKCWWWGLRGNTWIGL